MGDGRHKDPNDKESKARTRLGSFFQTSNCAGGHDPQCLRGNSTLENNPNTIPNFELLTKKTKFETKKVGRASLRIRWHALILHTIPFLLSTTRNLSKMSCFVFSNFNHLAHFFAVLGSRKLSTLPCISTGERMLPTFSCRIPFFINLSFLSFFCFS